MTTQSDKKKVIIIAVSIALIAIFFIFIPYIKRYFFIFDDFSLIGNAHRNSFKSIFNSGLIGYYRPLVFTLLKMQFTIFGWDNPSGYLVVSIITHSINAVLVGLLVRILLGFDNLCYVFSSIIFLLSPWIGESIFWLSCQFDIFAATGVLMALIFALKADNVVNAPLKKISYLVFMTLSGCLGLFSKEMCITLPLLLTVVMLFRYTFISLLRHKLFLIEFLLLTIVVLVYIFIRNNFVSSPFSGGGSNYFMLLKSINPIRLIHAVFMPPIDPRNVARLIISTPPIRLIHAVFMPPIDPSGNFIYWLGSKLFIFTVVIIFIHAFIYRVKESIMTIIGFMISLIPVIWGRIGLFGTDGGRLLYSPNIFIAFGLGIGLHVLLTNNRKWFYFGTLFHKTSLRGIAAIFALYLIVSLNYQKDIWTKAYSLSRHSLETFAKYIDKGTYFYIKDLPCKFIQGPYILKSYAFSYYYHDRDIKVRADHYILSYKNGALFFISKESDEYSQYEKEANEVIVNIDLNLVE